MTQSTASGGPAARLPLPPGPRGNILLGNLPDLRRDILGLFRDTAREYGDVARLRLLGFNFYCLSHPDHFKHVLQDNNRNYRRSAFFNGIVKMASGDNLFTLDGDDWLSRRRLMQPVFHRERITAFTTLMSGATEAMLAGWDRCPDSQRLDLDQEIMGLTLRIAGQTLFSVDLLGEAGALGAAFTNIAEHIKYRLRTPVPPPLFIPTPVNRRFRRAIRTLDRTIYRIIEERRDSKTDGGDLLSMLMQARDAETGEGMSDRDLRDEVALLMYAGHETTAPALVWTFYLLSQNPEAEKALHAELESVLGGRAPTADDLPKLSYTRMVIDEAMRLYPPAWAINRQSIGEDEIGGYRIPPNASVTLAIINVHHDPRWWEEPEKFDPLRFTPEQTENRTRFSYSPFGGGPRLCIGMSFALTEAQIILATIAQRYRLRLVPGHPVRPHPQFVLRPNNGLPMTAHQR